jgi:type I restriction enzyme S subunit
MSESNLVQNIDQLKNLPKTWVIRDFAKIVSDNSGGNKKLAKTEFLESGEIAIVDQGKELIAGYYNNLTFLVKTKPPYIVFGDHTRIFKFIDFPFIMGADGTKVLQPKDNNCSTKFLYYFFLSINIPETGYNRHFKYLKELQIPLPPLEQQKKIASISPY